MTGAEHLIDTTVSVLTVPSVSLLSAIGRVKMKKTRET